MPAFTFEKISPPIQHDSSPVAPSEKKPRGVIFQVLERFFEKRVERAHRVDKGIIARREQREPE